MRTALLMGLCIFFGLQARAQTTVTLQAGKDNTIYQNTSASNGAGENCFAGKTDADELRRALIYFDIASFVPTGATITAVRLELHCVRGNADAQNISLHKLNAAWGEGTSNAAGDEVNGTLAATGDATWHQSIVPNANWSVTGGSYAVVQSAGCSIGGAAQKYTWTGPNLVNEVQNWLNAPATNFGWALVGNEMQPGSLKGFATKEHPLSAYRPRLLVTYNTALPILLFRFGARAIKNNVELEWVTEQEVNNDYFSLEVSRDAVSFDRVAKIKGAGNSFVRQFYKHTHVDVQPGTYYYRIVQHDLDGKLYLSDIVKVQVGFAESPVLLHHNPISTDIRLLYLPGNEPERFMIYDATGKLIKAGKVNSYLISAQDLLPGNHILRLAMADGKLLSIPFTKL